MKDQGLNLKLSQTSYSFKVRERLSMINANFCRMRTEEQILSVNLTDKKFSSTTNREANNSSIDLMICNRTDIAFEDSLLSRLMEISSPCPVNSRQKGSQTSNWKKRFQNYDWYRESCSWHSHSRHRLGLDRLQGERKIHAGTHIQYRWMSEIVRTKRKKLWRPQLL